MKKFNKIKSVPAYLPLINIDTDMIIPKQFLKTIKRTGLGKSLFYEMRYDEEGKIIENFILNKEPYSKSRDLFLFNHSIIFLTSLITSGPIPSPGSSNNFLFFLMFILNPRFFLWTFFFQKFQFHLIYLMLFQYYLNL